MRAQWKTQNIHHQPYVNTIYRDDDGNYQREMDFGESKYHFKNRINEKDFYFNVAESLEIGNIECDMEYQALLRKLKDENCLLKILELVKQINIIEEYSFYRDMKDTWNNNDYIEDKKDHETLENLYNELLKIMKGE